MDDFSPVLHKYRLRKCFFHLLGAPLLVPRQFSDMSLHSILPQVSSVKSAAEVQIWYIEVSGFLENNLICAVCDVATSFQWYFPQTQTNSCGYNLVQTEDRWLLPDKYGNSYCCLKSQTLTIWANKHYFYITCDTVLYTNCLIAEERWLVVIMGGSCCLKSQTLNILAKKLYFYSMWIVYHSKDWRAHRRTNCLIIKERWLVVIMGDLPVLKAKHPTSEYKMHKHLSSWVNKFS